MIRNIDKKVLAPGRIPWRGVGDVSSEGRGKSSRDGYEVGR